MVRNLMASRGIWLALLLLPVGCAASPAGAPLRPTSAPVRALSSRPLDDAVHLVAAHLEEEPPPAVRDQEIGDEVEAEESAPVANPVAHSDARLQLSNAELAKRFESEPEQLGSLSIGRASSGALVNGVRMPESELYQRMDPNLVWGTEETVRQLTRAIEKVNTQFPDGHLMRIGHISKKHGGRISPHRSHQSGRDVDVSYYYRTAARYYWYRRASSKNLDLDRTWAFVRALVTETDVEYVFINSYIQRLIKKHALSVGEDPSWLDSLFQVGSAHPRPLIRHATGHDTHIHVRFYNPVAQELGRRAHLLLVDKGIIKPSKYYLRHRARKGDILGNLAKRYRTTVKAIMRANGLRNVRIRAGRTYLIPRKGKVKPTLSKEVTIPARRLPPPQATGSGSLAAPEDASPR
jgi:murein endopeptidase